VVADVVHRQVRYGREGGGTRRDDDGPTALGATATLGATAALGKSAALAADAPFPFPGRQLAGTQLVHTRMAPAQLAPMDDVAVAPLLAGETSAASMRLLEISLACGAIATAVLIGMLR
jgi:hypothetical protein